MCWIIKYVNSIALMISRSDSENLCPTLTKHNVMQSSTVALKRKVTYSGYQWHVHINTHYLMYATYDRKPRQNPLKMQLLLYELIVIYGTCVIISKNQT